MNLNTLSNRSGFTPAIKVRGLHTGKCGWVEPHCYDTTPKLLAAIQRRIGGGAGLPEQPYELVATHLLPVPLQQAPDASTELIAFAKVMGAVGLHQRQALLIWYDRQPAPLPGNAAVLHQAMIQVYVGRYGSYDADDDRVLKCYLEAVLEQAQPVSSNPLDYWVAHGFVFRQPTLIDSFFDKKI